MIYSIGLLFGDEMSRAEVRHARRALEMLSTETGGLAFFPKSMEEVDQIAAEVARDIRSQYTIGYHSTKPTTEPGFRRVLVTAAAKGVEQADGAHADGIFPGDAGDEEGEEQRAVKRGRERVQADGKRIAIRARGGIFSSLPECQREIFCLWEIPRERTIML